MFTTGPITGVGVVVGVASANTCVGSAVAVGVAVERSLVGGRSATCRDGVAGGAAAVGTGVGSSTAGVQPTTQISIPKTTVIFPINLWHIASILSMFVNRTYYRPVCFLRAFRFNRCRRELMTLNLGIPFLVLLLSVFATLLTTVIRPTWARLVALVGTALTCFIWFASRSSLPLSWSIGPQAAVWPVWSWQAGALSWSVSLALLLLALAAVALEQQAARTERGTLDHALIQLLVAVGLLACWAGNLTTYVMAWAFLNGLWVFVLEFSSNDPFEGFKFLPRRIALAFTSVLLLWLAAASAGPNADLSGITAWPTLTRSLVLLAATYQLGVFSFHLWHSYDGRLSGGRAALLHAAPAASGALLLARLESASDIALAFALPFTLLGFYALLAGARRAWIATEEHASAAFALFQAQAGFVLLAGVWAEPQAVLAETAVLLLGGGVLLLANGCPLWDAQRRLPNPGPAIALAALAAVPLTAGFAGRSALYDAWLADGRWLLVLVTALLHIPLLAAAIHAMLPVSAAAEEGATSSRFATLDLSRLVALLLPTLALFSVAALSGVAPVVWPAILLPIAVAVLVAWRVEEVAELRQTIHEAFAIPLSPAPIWSGVRLAASALSTSTREALAILEGEGGLLWLFVFVVIVYLAH